MRFVPYLILQNWIVEAASSITIIAVFRFHQHARNKQKKTQAGNLIRACKHKEYETMSLAVLIIGVILQGVFALIQYEIILVSAAKFLDHRSFVGSASIEDWVARAHT